MKKQKILFIVHEYYPEDTRVRWQAESLVNLGHNVTVICLKSAGQPTKEKLNEVKIIRLPVKRHRGASHIIYVFEYLSFLILSTLVVLGLSIKYRFDLVQVASPPDLLVFSAVFPKMYGAKIILDIHDSIPHTFKARSKVSGKNIVFRILKKIQSLSIAFCDKGITVSEPMKNLLAEDNSTKTIYSRKITVVVNALDNRRIARNTPINEEKSSRNDIFTMIYHGKLINEYRVDEVIQAIYYAKESIEKPFVFQIYGKGPRWNTCNKLIKELKLNNEVILNEFVEHQVILEKVREADVGVVPLCNSEYADLALPRKFLEYVCLEIPVIIPRKKTISHYFDDSSAFFYSAGNIKQLSQKILLALENDQLRKSIAEKARQQYQNINFVTMRKKYLKVVLEGCTNL